MKVWGSAAVGFFVGSFPGLCFLLWATGENPFFQLRQAVADGVVVGVRLFQQLFFFMDGSVHVLCAHHGDVENALL